MICWHGMDSCPRDADGKGRNVLVWHVYQHCMVYDSEKALRNRFVVRWMEIPDRWIPIAERKPTYRDANVLGVVIVKDRHGEVKLRGWHPACNDPQVTEWMPTPDAPDDYLELREKAAELPSPQERNERNDISQHHKQRDQRNRRTRW